MTKSEKTNPRGAMTPAVRAAYDKIMRKLPPQPAKEVPVAGISEARLAALAETELPLDPPARDLLRALFVLAIANPHESGWPELDAELVSTMAGSPEKEWRPAMRELFSKGLVQTRVSGRKRPTRCFRLPWLPEAAEGEEEICRLAADEKAVSALNMYVEVPGLPKEEKE